MAASNAVTGYDGRYAVETAPGSGTYFELAETTNITVPKPTVDETEVTHMQSPNRAKEFKAGLADYGTSTEKGNYIPMDATDVFLLAWRADGTTRSVKATQPGGHTQVFPGFCKEYGVDDYNASSALKRTLVVRVAGAVAYA